MKSLNRRKFLKDATIMGGGVISGFPLIMTDSSKNSPNNTVNVAVVGIRSRGRAHYQAYSKIPGVNIAAVCDIDERLFPKAVNELEKMTGKKPKTYIDFRKLLEDRDIDAVSIATPDHWHALQTIWACQAGKDVYVEKPVSWCVEEGRKAVQAARKYNRVVQVGAQYRSSNVVREAVKFIREGNLGDVHLIKTFYHGPRGNIGHKKDSPVPKGVEWDLFLGPAPYRPFNENRFHYTWHWFWETGNSDLTANGVHYIDIARWSLGKRVHPVSIHCDGDYYAYDSDQETPNIIFASCVYEDRKIVQFDIRNLYTPKLYTHKGGEGLSVGDIFFGSEGWMELGPGEFKTFFGRKNEPGPGMSEKELAPDPMNRAGTGGEPHFINFIDCVRSGRWQDLNSDILEGHMSAAICHLAEISYRTGRKLTFNPHSEKFVNDDEANSYLTRDYRYPYVVPDEV